MLELNKIHCGDNCDLMGRMPRECVDLVVTSPPYDARKRTCGSGSPQVAIAQRSIEQVTTMSWKQSMRDGRPHDDLWSSLWKILRGIIALTVMCLSFYYAWHGHYDRATYGLLLSFFVFPESWQR